MTTWQFFAAWLLFLMLCIALSYIWARLRGADHPLNGLLDIAFAGRRRMLEYVLLMALAALITGSIALLARPWWSEPTAPRGKDKPVVIRLHPDG